MGTIRESCESALEGGEGGVSPSRRGTESVRSPGKGPRSPHRRSAAGGGLGGTEEEAEDEYEDDFDEDFEDEDDADGDLYDEGDEAAAAAGAAVSGQDSAVAARCSGEVSTRPLSAKCSDALDFQRRQQGIEEEEDIVEEAQDGEGAEEVDGLGGDGAFDDDDADIAEEEDGEESFESAAISAQSHWTAQQLQQQRQTAGLNTRVLSATNTGRTERAVIGPRRAATATQRPLQQQPIYASPAHVHPASAGARRGDAGAARGLVGGEGAVRAPDDMQAVLAALAKENSSVASEVSAGDSARAGESGAAGLSREGGGEGGAAAVRNFPRMPSAKKSSFAATVGRGREHSERTAPTNFFEAPDDGKAPLRPMVLGDADYKIPEGVPCVSLGGGQGSTQRSSRRYCEVQASLEGGSGKALEDSAGGNADDGYERRQPPHVAPNELTIEV